MNAALPTLVPLVRRAPATLPRTKDAFVKDAWNLHLVFNRPLDSATVSKGEWINNSPTNFYQSIRILPPHYTEVILTLSQPLTADSIITLNIKDLTNCSGGKEAGSWTVKTGLATPATRGSIILNEILFNPRSSGEEFVECLNTSKKIIALSDLRIALRNSGGQLGSSYKLANYPIALLPGQHIAFSKDTHAIKREYLVTATATLQQINPFITLPNEEGRIVLLNTQGEILDELHYDESWHFELLQQKEGVSLERIDPTTTGSTASKCEGFGAKVKPTLFPFFAMISEVYPWWYFTSPSKFPSNSNSFPSNSEISLS